MIWESVRCFAITAFVSSYLSQYHVLLAVAGTLLFGAFAGAVNGFMVTKMKIHPWVATLSMMLGLRGLVLVLTGENTYKPESANAALKRSPVEGSGRI